MNLIHCVNDCIHQQEGCCNLQSVQHVTAIPEKGHCAYYTQQLSAAKDSVKSLQNMSDPYELNFAALYDGIGKRRT